jgi:hypothetical protein
LPTRPQSLAQARISISPNTSSTTTGIEAATAALASARPERAPINTGPASGDILSRLFESMLKIQIQSLICVQHILEQGLLNLVLDITDCQGSDTDCSIKPGNRFPVIHQLDTLDPERRHRIQVTNDL